MDTMTEHPATGPFPTITAAKAANKAAGLHFFDKDSMRFFRSRIESKMIRGRYFITSEQFVGSDGTADPRRFTVRMVEDDGSVESVGNFQGYATLAEAKAAVPRDHQ